MEGKCHREMSMPPGDPIPLSVWLACLSIGVGLGGTLMQFLMTG
ncbi:putative membrane protein [Synechococcus sp. MVIR-18-1]|nr:putative membrane protein [Synechococcus sp. MVIR-18-1]